MTLTDISKQMNTSRQNITQIASKAIRKLFKNTRSIYKLSYLETYEMLLVGLDIYPDDSDVDYFYNQLDENDKHGIELERKKGKFDYKKALHRWYQSTQK